MKYFIIFDILYLYWFAHGHIGAILQAQKGKIFMDYSKIRLANERNSHVTKRLNRLSTWKFFKVIYRENIWRMFGYNFLMLLCFVPIFVLMMLGGFEVSKLQSTLPELNSLGFSTGVWTNVNDYFARQTRLINTEWGWYSVLGALLFTVMFSGGFAVIRDAFWTGKLSAVGVFKSMWMGFKSNILYALASTAVLALAVFGIYEFYVYMSTVILWLAIVLTVLLAIVALFLAMYLMILCSVSVTYKQSVYENLDDSWRLLWLNVLPNLIHLIIALIPIALYFLFQGNFLQQIVLILLLMFGGLYFPLVWQTHMMKTFALFHPVEVKKKKAKQVQTAERYKQGAKSKSERSADVRSEVDELSEPVEDATSEVSDEILEEDVNSVDGDVVGANDNKDTKD